MPATPEQLLALLEAPHWKTPGSTSRKTEGPTARRTEGQAAVNVTVLDHISKGHRALADAASLAQQGTTLAARQAAAIREAQAIRSEALMGETGRVRKGTCPYCGTYGVILHKGRAQCINRHCAPAGVQRSWSLVEFAMTTQARPMAVRRTTTGIPSDARPVEWLVNFLKDTGRPVPTTTLRRIIRIYALPHWAHPVNTKAHLYSLSDVLTAHAVHAAKGNPSDCAAAAKPACSGLADAFFTADTRDTVTARMHAEDAKALCDGCPFKDPCLEVALALPDHAQHGIQGGLTAKERRTHIAGTRPTNGEKTHCVQGHPFEGDNLRIRPNGDRQCRACQKDSRRRSRAKNGR